MISPNLTPARPDIRGLFRKGVFPSGVSSPVGDDTPIATEEVSRGKEAVEEVCQLKSNELGRRVAEEVMGWHLESNRIVEAWVDETGELTGYYNGRPFSPYRDRNALIEVWRRIEAIHLRKAYLSYLVELVSYESVGETPDFWMVHTCEPERSCRAALLAVRLPR